MTRHTISSDGLWNKKIYLILPTRLSLLSLISFSGSEKKNEHIRPTKAPGNIPKWKKKSS
jgi:hypothetical protein